MTAFCKGHGSGSTWRGRGFDSATILTGFNGQTASNFCHDRTTIAPRLGHDRASIVILELRRSSSARVEYVPRWKTCDRSSITARSDRDREALPRRLCTV